MTKAELIDKVAASVDGMSKAEAAKAFDTIFETIASALKHDGKFTIQGFGTFEVKHLKERMGRNPRTGEAMKVEASTSVKFKPSETLKTSVGK